MQKIQDAINAELARIDAELAHKRDMLRRLAQAKQIIEEVFPIKPKVEEKHE